MDNKYTSEDLKTMQSWSFERKIQVTQTRIMEWCIRLQNKVYVSFSGGVDSTVLLDLVRRVEPEIPAVFVDTGLEYPEIREFVKTKENVEWLRPIKYDHDKREWVPTNFREVIMEYGYPVIGKEVARAIRDVRKNPNACSKRKFDSNSDYVKKYGKRFDLSRWQFLLDSDIMISEKCCDIMKKNPAKQYEKATGRFPILGTMAYESLFRKSHWLKNGCNGFDKKRPTSQPMSFWLKQDALRYLKEFNIPYASVYGDIVEDKKGKLITTGVQRTGCMFCMFGCHMDKEPNRFQQMKISHPALYDYCIRPVEDNGLGIGKVLDFINVKY